MEKKETKRTLIINDSNNHNRIASTVLRNNGFDPIVSHNGLEALEIIETKKIELVLIDLDIDQMPALEFISLIRGREEFEHLPVICLSKKETHPDFEEAKSYGDVGFLCKSFNPKQLLDEVFTLVPKEENT